MIRLHCLILIQVLPILAMESDDDSLHVTTRSRWHVVTGFSSSDLSASSKIKTSYGGSGYTFIASPRIYSLQIGIQRNLAERVRLAAEIKTITADSYRASNWYKQVTNATQNSLNERFDAFEKLSGTSAEFFLHFIVVPLVYPNSRFEIAVSPGLSVSHLEARTRHEYVFCRPPTCSEDTSFSRKVGSGLFGGLLGLNIDFYWTRSISSQFRITGRSTTTLSIPSVTYTYYTLDRNNNRLANERRVSSHPVGLSGIDFSLSLLFHL